MPNELLWVVFILIDLSLAILVFRTFGRIGLYGIIVIDIILCNIQVMKVVRMFGLVTTLGNVLYGSIFFATDLLSELYGKREARRGVWLGFAALVMATIFMQLTLRFTPDQSDFMHPALSQIFSFLPRIAAASLIAYIISQHHDVWAFHFWKNRTKGRWLWFRNNVSTSASQLMDTVIFCSIAFWGLFPLRVFAQISLTTYLFKLLVAVIDTPFIYWGRRIGRTQREWGA